MTDKKKQMPLGTIDPKKMSAEQLKAAKTARPNAAMADEASPVQQQMEATSMVQRGNQSEAGDSFLITDSDLPMRAHYILFGVALFFAAFVNHSIAFT